MEQRSGKNMNHLPGNQSCYRREILMAYGQDLADALEADGIEFRMIGDCCRPKNIKQAIYDGSLIGRHI